MAAAQPIQSHKVRHALQISGHWGFPVGATSNYHQVRRKFNLN